MNVIAARTGVVTACIASSKRAWNKAIVSSHYSKVNHAAFSLSGIVNELERHPIPTGRPSERPQESLRMNRGNLPYIEIPRNVPRDFYIR